MLDWQRTLLVIWSMTLVVVCRLSKTCVDNSAIVDHLACVVVGAIFGAAYPGLVKRNE